MKTIKITKYKPYEHIRLSQEVILNSLCTDSILLGSAHATMKSEPAKQSPINKSSTPVVIFGELEWMLMKMA